MKSLKNPFDCVLGSSCSVQLDTPGDQVVLVDAKLYYLIMYGMFLIWGSGIPLAEFKWVLKYSTTTVVFSRGCWIRDFCLWLLLAIPVLPWQDEVSLFLGTEGWGGLVSGPPAGWRGFDLLGAMCGAGVSWLLVVGSGFGVGTLCQTSTKYWLCTVS